MRALALFWIIGSCASVSAEPAPAADGSGRLRRLDIVTPQWMGQTDLDGGGLFFEIMREVYEPQGILIAYRFVPWKRAQKMVSTAAADAMLCVWREDADKAGQLTPRYPLHVELTAAIFKKGRINGWTGIDTLNGKSAVWLRGYDFHTSDHLQNVRFASWSEVNDHAHAWRLLDSGRYDVHIDALIDLEHYIASQRLDMASYQLEVLWGQNAYVAFSATEKSEALIEIYDRRIRELFKAGTLAAIYEKWGVRFSPDAWQPQRH
jgi:polar amino acid transport system substrate-binding protein